MESASHRPPERISRAKFPPEENPARLVFFLVRVYFDDLDDSDDWCATLAPGDLPIALHAAIGYGDPQLA